MGRLRRQAAAAVRPDELAGAAALGVDEHLRARVGRLARQHLRRADAGVDVALAHPELHVVAPERLLEPGAEEDVGQEEDRPLRRDRADDRRGVAAGHAVIRLGLDRRRGVDVAHDHRPRMRRLPGAQLLDGDRVGERAAGGLVGNQHRARHVEDLGRLGHEVDAAHRDDRRRGARGLDRQAE